MTRHILSISQLAIWCMLLASAVHAQPFTSSYPFAFGPEIIVGNGLLPAAQPAGALGRVSISPDGHFVTPTGERIRLFGVSMQLTACMPDSLTAIATASRLRALGVNAVRFSAFDLAPYAAASIFAEGNATSALDPERMRRFDWFIHQLKQQGIYTVLTFHSIWQPRPGDGVRQPDSLGWGARTPIFFDPVVQNIHRRIIRMVLEHVNPYTGAAYKDETAIPYIVAVEDASLVAYWMYSQDITRPNQYGTANVGSQHLRLMDSLFAVYLRGTGLTSDAMINNAWKTTVQSPANLLRNGSFEDPFLAAWVLGVNTTGGAQAVEQFSDADSKDGATSYRLRIGKLGTAKQTFDIFVSQGVNPIHRLRRYRCSFWARTTPQRGQREILTILFNGTYPYNTYGLSETTSLTDAWKRFDYTFTCTSTDESTGMLGFMCGQDTGDVYIDDVRLTEEPFPGLLPGETLAGARIQRSSFWDENISPARAKAVADFYRTSVTNMLDGVRKLVRDTLKSNVLLCPSTRTQSHLDQVTAAGYEVTSSMEWRGNPNSMLTETGGGSILQHAQSRIVGKAHVVSHASIQFPRQYQNDMMSVVPAYAGLQDWDAYFPGFFASNSILASAHIDSNIVWEIFNKPNILALMPFASQRFIRGDVVPSLKVVTIDVGQEALDVPRLHAPNPYSLSVYSDARLPLFRRVATNLGIAAQESFLPHREVSVLTGDVDVRALDAENEQIFWNAATGILRVATPRSVSVTGRLVGELVEVGGMRVEQLDTVQHVVVGLATLDTLPLATAMKALLVVSTRALNEGATWNARNTELDAWGGGTTMMEGTSVRITLPATIADSCIIQPLGENGMARGASFQPTRGSTGRFSFTVNTATASTPWFQLRFARTPTSVAEAKEMPPWLVHESAQARLRVAHEALERVDVTDMNGRPVIGLATQDRAITLDLHGLTTGAYMVRMVAGGTVFARPVIHVR